MKLKKIIRFVKMKLKKMVRFAIIGLICVAVAYSAYAIWRQIVWSRTSRVNLVANPDFEVIKDSEGPMAWSEDALGGWSIDTDNPYEGQNSMRGTVGWSWLWQDIRVRPKKAYRLRAYLRSDIKIPGETNYENAFMTLECRGGRKRKVLKMDYGIVNATSTWQPMERDIYAPPKTRKIRIKLAKRQGEGSIWFDKVKLTEIPFSLLLHNPDFEVLDGVGGPKEWTEHAWGGWSIDTDDPYEGENSMRATVGWSWLSQDFSARPKRYYTLEAYVRSDIVVPQPKDYENTFLTLECLNENYEIIGRSYGILNVGLLWQPKESSIYTPEGTKKIRIKLAKRQGEGSVWFDKVKLTEKPSYMRFVVVRKILKDTPFFVFYISVYIILLASLLRLLLKRQRQ